MHKIKFLIFTVLSLLLRFQCIASSSDGVGEPLRPWQKGQLQIHFIHTGVAESAFYIFPDSTSLLLDCGDKDALSRGRLSVPVLPNGSKHSGEWIARYILRVNPRKDSVDYMMLSHYHADHGGTDQFYADKKKYNGKTLYMSGFSHAAEYLKFAYAIDRAYPKYNEPELLTNEHGNLKQMKSFYNYYSKEKGLRIEKFIVGATDQLQLRHRPVEYPSFHIRNICGNGYIADRQGNLTNVYKQYLGKPKAVNENAMSLGMIISYGQFRLYTAADFCGARKMEDGTKLNIEDALADVVEHVNVAKVNHHGYKTMPKKLIRVLSPQVFVSCVWDQLHSHSSTLARLSDRDLYEEDRIICPTVFPKERLIAESNALWIKDIPSAAYNGGHVVVTVEPDTKKYTVNYVTAEDESMVVTYSKEFECK